MLVKIVWWILLGFVCFGGFYCLGGWIVGDFDFDVFLGELFYFGLCYCYGKNGRINCFSFE